MLPGGTDARRHPRFRLTASTVELRRHADDALLLIVPATDVSLGGLHVLRMGHELRLPIGERVRIRLFEGDATLRVAAAARVVRHSATGVAFTWEREDDPALAALIATLR